MNGKGELVPYRCTLQPLALSQCLLDTGHVLLPQPLSSPELGSDRDVPKAGNKPSKAAFCTLGEALAHPW